MASTPTTESQSRDILDKIAEFRKGGQFTDFKLICDGVVFNVHKVIICSQSAVFLAACTGNFKESEESTYHLPDEMSFVVDKLIDYLYTGDYSEPTDKGPEDCNPTERWDIVSPLQLHAKLFALGDKYDIPELCDLALENYSERAGEEDPFEYLDSLADVFFSPTIQNTALKEAAVRIPRRYLGVRLQDESVRMKYDSVITQVPEYANQLLHTFWELPYMSYCDNCEPDTPLWPTIGKCRKCRPEYKLNWPRPAKQ